MMLPQSIRSLAKRRKWQARLLGDIEQTVLAVRKIEHPKHSQLIAGGVGLTAHGSIQPALAQAGFTFWILIQIGVVVLQNFEDRYALVKRVLKTLGANKFQIIRRAVVLRETTIRSSHQATHGKIEAGRAILPFVISPGRKLVDLVILPGVFQDVGHCPVNFGVAATAFLVSRLPRVSHAGENQAMPDARRLRLVLRQPDNRTESGGRK